MFSSLEADPLLHSAYREAEARVPVVPRTVLRLHKAYDLGCEEIAHRLGIDSMAPLACVAEALGMISSMLDGYKPRRMRSATIAFAEDELHRRHRIYCEDHFRVMGIPDPIAWTKKSDDDDLTIATALLYAAPPDAREAACLFFADRLTLSQIARRTRTMRQIVERRLIGLIEQAEGAPANFECWLYTLGQQSENDAPRCEQSELGNA